MPQTMTGFATPAPAGPIPLTVLIRTLNEADRLPSTIEAARPLGAEIVVIDGGSTDGTQALARSMGAVVVENPWPGFGPQRHFGEDKCSNDHVFSLDADEILPPRMIAEIREIFLTGAPPALMIVRKAGIFPHHLKPPPLGFCHEQILIYDRRVARTGPNPNWDKLEISTKEKPIKIKTPLWHFSQRDLNHAVTKTVYVAQLAADTQPRRSQAMLRLRVLTEFPFVFFKYYFIRRYCLAGFDGFVMAMLGAYGRFIRIAMMLERVDFRAD